MLWSGSFTPSTCYVILYDDSQLIGLVIGIRAIPIES